jgi:predicted Fe-S protein YdhL (DUF1289 family)
VTGSPAAPGRRPLPIRPVASPCTSVCKIDPADGLCIGCHRTIEEIASWGAMTDEQRRVVWAELRVRREARRAARQAP